MCIDKADIISGLLKNNSWLASSMNRVSSLNSMFDQCSADEEILLTKELLERYVYISHTERAALMAGMARYIARHFSEGSAIIAMTFGRDADSGQKVVNDLKGPLLMEMPDICSVKPEVLYNNMKYLEGKRRITPQQIFIVDEFCGSGKTISGRIGYIKEKPHIRKVHFCLLAGMEYAYDILREEHPDVSFHFGKLLKRGIGDADYDFHTKRHKINTMLDMECKLSEKYGEKFRDDYSLGYGCAQSLVYFEDGNVPNSVFPWFWWRYNSDGMIRNPLFTRYEKGMY